MGDHKYKEGHIKRYRPEISIEGGGNKKRELSVDNIQLAYGGITRIRASYYKDREGKPLHMYTYLNMK